MAKVIRIIETENSDSETATVLLEGTDDECRAFIKQIALALSGVDSLDVRTTDHVVKATWDLSINEAIFWVKGRWCVV